MKRLYTIILFILLANQALSQQKGLFFDKKPKRMLDNSMETLENFEVEDSKVLYKRIYTMPDIKEADLKQLYLEYIKNQDNISKVEVNDYGVKAYISDLYISGPKAKGVPTNNEDFENFSIGYKKTNVRAGVKGWQMFFLSSLNGKVLIQFKDEMYRVVVSDMWTKNVNDQNDDFEFWVLAQDQTTFADEFFYKNKAKRTENYLRAIQGFNIFLEDKFKYKETISSKKNDDW